MCSLVLDRFTKANIWSDAVSYGIAALDAMLSYCHGHMSGKNIVILELNNIYHNIKWIKFDWHLWYDFSQCPNVTKAGYWFHRVRTMRILLWPRWSSLGIYLHSNILRKITIMRCFTQAHVINWCSCSCVLMGDESLLQFFDHFERWQPYAWCVNSLIHHSAVL